MLSNNKLMNQNDWNVHKFGGSSLKDANSYSFVASLINHLGGKNFVIVSALSGVTNQLYDLCTLARSENCLYSKQWTRLVSCIASTIQSQLGISISGFNEMCHFIGDLICVISALSKMALSSPKEQDLLEQLIVGYGEIWSARLLAQIMCQNHCQQASFLDARKILYVQPRGDDINVCWDESQRRLENWLKHNHSCDLVIVTGFIAMNIENGLPTTLKRNGSDFTATIFSALVKANSVTIWKDVDGVFTSDPHKDPNAQLIRQLSYEAAEQACRQGDFAIQSDCIVPAKLHNIPILLKNCFKLDCPGTKIS